MFESLTGGQQAQTKDICVAWDANALQYLAKGYSVIPLMPRQKGPKLGGWSNYCEQLMDPDTARQHCGKNNNIGLCLGPASNLCAVDIDTDDPELIKKIEKLLPVSPLRKKGAKGFTVFDKYNGMDSKSVKDEKGNGLDFLSKGRQTVLPPSIHPSGMPYQWLTSTTLLDVDKKDLPELPISAIEQVLALFKAPVVPRKEPERVPMQFYQDAAIEDARLALTYLDADESYEQWVQIGLALNSAFGDEKGFELFNEWSAKGSQGKYDGTAKCYKKYRSLENPEQITISTLFFYARAKGYQGTSDWGYGVSEEDVKKFDDAVDDWLSIKKAVDVSQEETIDTILHPVGLVKTVYEWVKKTSMYRQDLFAAAAATSVVSLAYAKKFSFRENKTNNYIIAVGPAGCGKGRICDQAQWLVQHAPEAISSKLIGEFRSDVGFIDALLGRDGIIYAYIDEIGQYLRNIKGENTSAYTRAIGSELIKMFSRASGTYSTAAYSSKAKRDIINIECPCAIVFGQSVPSRLFESLTKADFEDGFVPRFTLIEVKMKSRIPVKNPDYVSPREYFPQDIYDFMERLESWTQQARLKKDFMNAANETGDTSLKVPATPEAEALLDQIEMEINQRRDTMEETDLRDKPLGRAFEQILKYSLCACEWENNRPVITAASVKWAKAFVNYHLMTIEDHLPDITGSDYAKTRQEMLRCLPMDKKLTEAEFHTHCKDIQPNTRKQIMDDLLHQGCLTWVVEGDKKYIRRIK